MVNRLICGLVIALGSTLACSAPPLPTALNPEADAWYRWRIVLRVKPHPLLGPNVRTQLAKDIAAAVAPGVSKFADVEVVDLALTPAEKKEALWTAFEKDGWNALVQQPFRELTGIKTHFLTVEFRNGVYHLESRQHDGSTGLTSPVVRVRETRAEEQVARLAGQMLFPDFGAVGTIIGGKEGDPTGFVMKIRGSARGGMDSLVKAGDVFAVSVVTKNDPFADRPRTRGKSSTPVAIKPPTLLGTPREFTLLKAIAPPNADGTIRCTVVTRFETGLPPTTSGMVGVRALKLSGVSLPVRVRVLTEDGKPHPRASLLTVMGTDGDYAVDPGARDGFAYDPADGTFKSARPLQSIACLVVGLSPTYSERFPVPLVGNDVITVKFPINEEKARKAELEKATMALRLKIGESHAALTSLYAAAGRLVGEQRNRDALDRVREGIKTAEAVDQTLTAEMERVRKMPGAKLEDCEQQMKTFREWRDNLKKYETDLTAMAKLDPIRMEKEVRARDMSDRIKTLREQGEIPEALDLYDELIELTKQDEFRIEKEKLQREWATTDEPHRAAREVLLVKWPNVQTVEEFVKNTTPFVNAAEVMMKKGDRLGVRKLMNAFNPAYAKLNGLVQTLDPSVAEDQTKIEQINNVTAELRNLEGRVQDWLKKNIGKK